MHSLGTFIFQTPPLALLSSSLYAKPAVNITQTYFKYYKTYTCITLKFTRVVFSLLSSDDSYISAAGLRRRVCCCRLAKSSTPKPRGEGGRQEEAIILLNCLLAQGTQTVDLVNVSHLLQCGKLLPKAFSSLLKPHTHTHTQ